MGKYKARGGGSGYWLVGIILIIALGLIGLTTWLVIKNEAPATCDVSVSGVNIAQTAVSGTYPTTISYSGNGSNACPGASVSITATVTDSKSNKTTIPPSSPLPSISQGSYVIQLDDPKSTVSLVYFLVNSDGSEGPHHTYP
jgi:hypothetical protein